MRLAAPTVQLPLGFASGLPLYLGGSTLGAWLATENVDVETIALFSLVALPYSLKVLWAPLFDCLRLPWLGRRRSWLLLLQLGIMSALVAMACSDAHSVMHLAVLATALSVLSASQDVVVDAYRIDTVCVERVGRATALYVVGYRVALIVAGAGALVLASFVEWSTVYWLMAAAMLVGVVATILAPATVDVTASISYRRALIDPMLELLHRPFAATVLLVVALFKLGDAVAGHMVVPYLVGLDYSTLEIGIVQKGVGIAATIVGAVAGGMAVDRLGTLRSLVLFGTAQALANAGYLVLAMVGKSSAVLAAAVITDNLCNGLGTAAFVVFLTRLCDHQFSATQYALLTGISMLAGRLLAAASGVVIAVAGWGCLWALSIVVAVPGIAAAVRLTRLRISSADVGLFGQSASP